MKRQFQLSLLMSVLLLCATSAWGFEGRYYAKLTGKASTTTGGSGKVYVSATSETAVTKWDSKRNLGDYPTDEQWAAWENNNSNVEYVGALASADGIDLIASQFEAYARADEGSYFAGWSFSDGKTDLGTDRLLGLKLTPSNTRATMDPDDEMDDSTTPATLETKGTLVSYNAREYVLYATFEPLLIESYAVTGSNTTVNKICTQTVTFRIIGKDVDTDDFNTPTFVKQTGSGTWEVGELSSTTRAEDGDIVVPVKFTADNTDAGEFSTTLQLRSKAGKTMNVVLAARTLAGSGAGNAALFDGNTQMTSGTVEDMLAVNTSSYANPILKLSGDYSSNVAINKNLTFDLNGFALSGTLTVSGGNVSLAHSFYGGSITNNVRVTGGKLALNGGTITANVTVNAGAALEQNGAVITGNVTNNGTMTTTDGSITGQLASGGTLTLNGGTFTNNSGVAVDVTGGTAQIKRGTITGSTYGVQSAGTTTIEKLAAVSGETSALKRTARTLTVNSGKFADPSKLAEGDIVFKSAFFSTDPAAVAAAYEKQVWRNTAGVEFREGYLYFVGDQDAALASNVSVCRIGQTAYATLEEALEFAANHPDDQALIFMENDYTLKAGYYTVPANATVVVPMSDDQEVANPAVPRTIDAYDSNLPASFRKLIFESGVNINVLGTIELTCAQYYKGELMGIPGGNFGHLIMKPGSHMTINNGGELRAWGFVTGDGTRDASGTYLSGEIDARRGSVVREMFQMGDWKGGDISFTMIQPTGVPAMAHLFPVYMYFIQNIESPVKYHPGSSLICAASVNVGGTINAYANDIKVVGKKGEPAMFLMNEMADAENTWVRKWYDANKDQQVYEVNSGAQLGSMVINLGEVPGAIFGGTGQYKLELDSRKFVLPLTSNFKIHLLSGNMEFTQSTSCLPGMEVEVDKESEISIIPSDDPSVLSGALYFYDADQWSFDNNQMKGYVGTGGKFGTIVPYSATWDLGTNGVTKKPNVRDISSPAAIGDAKLIVHGTFRSSSGCSVYTTWRKGTDNPFVIDPEGTGGASIISTNEDAGTFIFDDPSPAFDGVHWDNPANFGQLEHMTGFGNSVLVNFDHNDYGDSNYPIQVETFMSGWQRMYGFELCTPAMLKNGNGEFVVTEGSPAGRSYCYMNDRWTAMEVAEEDGCFMKDNYGVFYAKPAEYVAVNARVEGGKVKGNDDHTFSDKDGAGRLFILMKDCQWWEVEKKDNLYHCIHPENDTYYYWDDSNPNPSKHGWKEKTFTITWKNWDGEEIKSYTYDPVSGEPEEVTYNVTYGTVAEFMGSNPTRDADIDYTYKFTGWTPALGKVTSNVTYTATYEKLQRKYTIIFENEGGVEIERQFLTHNEVPVCENTPTKVGHTLVWEPAIAAVTGDATYTATWLENPPTEYEVTFYDYDGTTVLSQDDVAVGEMPTSPAIVDGIPTGSTGKPATDEFTYVFDHWSPAMEEVSATSIKSYTAVYREERKLYTITFRDDEDNEIETKYYHYGETPVCSTPPTKANTAEWTYKLTWTPQIETVMENATYTADFETLKTKNKYTVTLKCNPSGAATLTGAGIYEYNTSVTIGFTNLAPGYEFVNWDDDNTDPSRSISVTGDIGRVANFRCPDCDNVSVYWYNERGTLLKEVRQEPGTATIYPGVTPTKAASDAYTYTFDGWSTSLNGALAYKNGMTPKAVGGEKYYAHFAATAIPSLEVSGDVNITEPITRRDLVITSDGLSSGQLFGINKLTLTGNAYFDLTVNAQGRTWFSIAVPWEVDAASGIYGDGQRLPMGTGYDIVYYDGARRAVEGRNNCWIYVERGESLVPGRLYMMVLANPASVIRFQAKNRSELLNTGIDVTEYPAAIDENAGWNGIANPALFHAFVNAGATIGQVFNSSKNGYDAIRLDQTKLVLGQGAFVQVPSDKSFDVIDGGTFSGAPSPARRAKSETVVTDYEVRIAPANKDYTDRLFVQVNEDKQKEGYMIGMDLQKMSVSDKVAQMWVERYDSKLCLNTVAPENEMTNFPLGISVPQTGEYSISIRHEANTGDAAVYLTRDGEAIWNLTNGAYTTMMLEGTDSRYGLRVKSKAPQSATGVDEAIVDNRDEVAAKVLINNQVFIIREGHVYSVDGQVVK